MAYRAALVCAVFSCAAFAGTIGPGANPSADPTFEEGIVYSVGTTTAGDVVICEPSVVSCSTGTPTSDWSDVLVFYNSDIGPFVADSSADANSVYVFSGDDTGGTFGGLANFLANYNGLSDNATSVTENPAGLTDYSGAYFVDSPDSAVPEPGTFSLMFIGGGAMLVRVRRSRRSN